MGNSLCPPKWRSGWRKAFGADRKRLFDMQAAYDRQERCVGEKEVAVRAFVPNFQTIKARQIEDWADGQIDADVSIPVQTLAHGTNGLTTTLMQHGPKITVRIHLGLQASTWLGRPAASTREEAPRSRLGVKSPVLDNWLASA